MRRSDAERFRGAVLVIAAAPLALFTLLGLLQACGASNDRVGPGGECFLATDCAPGLVCVEQQDRSRQCSNDLTRVAGQSAPDGAMTEEGDASREGGRQEGGTTPPPPGTNPPPPGTNPPPPGTNPPPPNPIPDAGSDADAG